VDPYRGLKTLRHDLTLDRGVSFQAAQRKLEHEQSAGDRSGFMRSRHASVLCMGVIHIWQTKKGPQLLEVIALR